MIARLWWKEARQVWPIWAFLAGLGLFWMSLFRWYAGPGPLGAFAGLAILITFVYLFLIGAAVFAGERENRTLGLLDALPVERWRVWVAKASFAAASTMALGALLSLFAMALEGAPSTVGRDQVAYFLVCGFGWSLFWSALLGNALLAAALGMTSLGLAFIQLNWSVPLMFVEPRPGALTVWHWAFAAALIPASALILQLGGPPRASWFGERRRSRPARIEGEATETKAGRRRFAGDWSALASRLVWQSFREVWPVWWPVALLGVGLPVAWAVGISSNESTPWPLSLLFVSLILGVNVFNAENRGGTQRFLAHHGARPGVVWLVKLAVGLATAAPIWFVILLMALYLRVSGQSTPAPQGWPRFEHFAYLAEGAIVVLSLFTGGFAAGAWCGMVFRRGITAGFVSLVFWLVVCLPACALALGGLMWPPHLFWVPVGILAVTWAWSGDWLLDRPGLGRWARLGLYSSAAVVVLFSAYVANRVWSIPTLDPAERERIFQFDRIAHFPTAPEANAADLYRRVGVNKLGHARIGDKFLDFQDVVYGNWDTSNPEVLDWLDRNAENLEMLRRAAAMPVCRFQDLRRATVFSMSGVEEGLNQFVPALAVSARVRLDQGDLKGAWTNIEALLRMGRQCSRLNPDQVRAWGDLAERWGLTLAMWWAADFHQTAELLESARDSYRAMPPLPSETDQLRADALVVHNTAEMPRGDLVQELLAREGKDASPLVKLAIDAMTTPWELARFHRAQDLMAAARIRLEGGALDHVGRYPKLDKLLVESRYAKGWDINSIRAMRLWGLVLTTPLGERLGVDHVTAPTWDNNAAPRRALDVIFGLLLWQVQHDGRLPRSLDELEAADPEIGPSLIDPFSNPPAGFGYVPSQGQNLRPLGLFDPAPVDLSGVSGLTFPTHGCMLLYSVGPDQKDDRALSSLNRENQGDIIFPLKDDVTPTK